MATDTPRVPFAYRETFRTRGMADLPRTPELQPWRNDDKLI
jgi:hypothetical protein